MAAHRYCLRCGRNTYPKRQTQGHFFLELVLWLCFLVPGFIYSIWRLTSRRKVCQFCGSTELVPPDSPSAVRMIHANAQAAPIAIAASGPAAAPAVGEGNSVAALLQMLLVISLLIAGVLVVAMMFGSGPTTSTASATPTNKPPNQEAKTDLSRKAAAIKIGSTRAAAIKALGAPTWAIIPTDRGEIVLDDPRLTLELRWRNPPCFHVAVNFGADGRVAGTDAGFICPAGYTRPDLPAAMLCSRPDRAIFCRP